MKATTTARLRLPPLRQTTSGATRRVGVELELSGLDGEQVAAIVAKQVKGRAEHISRYEHQIRGDSAGLWCIELDFQLLKELGRRPTNEGPLRFLDEAAEGLLRAGAERLVPWEVASPPLPLERLHEVQDLVERLREEGARGTTYGLTYAFGLQLNPEMPSTEAVVIARYLKAFLCLFDWLKERAQVDLARRLTPYIDPFPLDYVRPVVDTGYWPDIPGLVDDYLALNPTRNRALDMLPLFAHLDADRVRRAVEDPRIRPRPALHYRLPNCEIDRADWGIEIAWNDWLQVEHLAADPGRLDALCRAYCDFLDRPFGRLLEDWAPQVHPWLTDPAGL
jgi:hypothetical protein